MCIVSSYVDVKAARQNYFLFCFPLIRQKTFLEEKQRGEHRDVTSRGPVTSPTRQQYFRAPPKNIETQRKGDGPWRHKQREGPGGSPPAFSRTIGTSKSPSEAVFITYIKKIAHKS